MSDHVLLAYRSHDALTSPELVVFRFTRLAAMDMEEAKDVHTIMMLICPRKPAGLDLRLAGHLAEVVQSFDFERRWLAATADKEMNEILMRDDHFLHAPISDLGDLQDYVGRPLSEIELPKSCLIAIIERDGDVIIAAPNEVLQPGDHVAVIGEPEDLTALVKG